MPHAGASSTTNACPRILIHRKAIGDIQCLPMDYQNAVNDGIHRLRYNLPSDSKILAGRGDLHRTRKGDLRIVWSRENSDITIITVFRRGEGYGGVDRRRFDGPAIKWEHECAEEDDEAFVAGVKLFPVHSWPTGDKEAFYAFVHGGYRFTPELTPEQRDIYELLRNLLSSDLDDGATPIRCLQSAPGTGKSVCAAIFAAQLRRELDAYVALCVPSDLAKDLGEYEDVRRARTEKPIDGFHLGTLQEWMTTLSPDLALASPDEELAALRKRARYAGLDETSISPRDVVLYQAFVMDEGHGKNIEYVASRNRAEKLGEKIKPDLWRSALEPKLCRHDFARCLMSSSIPPPPYSKAIVFCDEVQDLLLVEVEAIVHILDAWRQDGVRTCLFLLGDLNQRIHSSGFYWDQVRNAHEISLDKNYRNTSAILEFANRFHEYSRKETSEQKGRGLPDPADPQSAYETGEHVRLLRCRSTDEAHDFLDELSRRAGGDAKAGDYTERRYAVNELARSAKVLWPCPDRKSRNGVVILDASRAKGREFESCVAFLPFEGDGKPTVEESFMWYTMLTRARARLTVVATEASLARIADAGIDLTAVCEAAADPVETAEWILEYASDIDIREIADPDAHLLQACKEGNPFQDTYPLLRRAGINVSDWESRALEVLRPFALTSRDIIERRMANAASAEIRCLLLRALDRSHAAAEVAETFRVRDPDEYRRLVEEIARDLNDKDMKLQAARLRHRIGKPWPPDLPMPELAGTRDDIVTSLCTVFRDRMANAR